MKRVPGFYGGPRIAIAQDRDDRQLGVTATDVFFVSRSGFVYRLPAAFQDDGPTAIAPIRAVLPDAPLSFRLHDVLAMVVGYPPALAAARLREALEHEGVGPVWRFLIWLHERVKAKLRKPFMWLQPDLTLVDPDDRAKGYAELARDLVERPAE